MSASHGLPQHLKQTASTLVVSGVSGPKLMALSPVLGHAQCLFLYYCGAMCQPSTRAALNKHFLNK